MSRKHNWVFAIILFNAIPRVSSSKAQIVCWYEVASLFETGVKHFSPADIDASLCSTIIYSNAVVNHLMKLSARYPNSEYTENMRGVYGQITSLKRPGLQVLLSVGNEVTTQHQFNTMVSSETMRRIFVASVTPMLDAYGFDGLDLSWSYPYEGTGNIARDKQDFLELLKELRTSLGDRKLSVTLFTSEGNYDFVNISQFVNMINMRYYLEKCGDFTCHMSAEINPASNYAEDRIQEWIKAGAPPKKLNLGLALFAEKRNLISECKGLACPATRVGFENYGPVCKEIKENGYTVLRIEPMGLPFAYKNKDWYGYQDPVSAEKWAHLAIKYNLGGIFVWSLHADDFNGICGGESYPLLNTIKRTFDDNPKTRLDDREQIDTRLSISLFCIVILLLLTLLSCVMCLRYQVSNRVTHITLDVQTKN